MLASLAGLTILAMDILFDDVVWVWEFFLTLGHEDMPVQASIRLLALVLRRPNHILANPLVPVMFCDYDYEETNSFSGTEG